MVARALFLLLVPLVAAAAEPAYRIVQIDHPKDLVLEVGGLARIPGRQLAAATRRGEIWILENPYAPEGEQHRWHRFASALHEPLGLAWHDGALYTMQRSELTRIRDSDGDGIADEYSCVAKGWGVSGAYHEYAYGPKFDPAGNMWVTLNCTMGEMTYRDQTQWRGYSLRVAPDGAWQPISGGMRSPSGIGINAAGDVFYSEQQGNYNCAGGVYHITKGAFHGHQASYASARLPGAPFPKPAVDVDRVPVAEVQQKIPFFKPPAVWLPYRKMGMSATDVTLENTGGKFGPFAGQFFVGEFTMSGINRVFLEKVDGEYQGACFPFLDGFQSGVLRMEFGEDGSMFVGETNRGWNSLGSRSYGLERVLFSRRTPFEIKTMEARPHGFRLTFTAPVDPASLRPANWSLTSFTYEYHAAYGGPELDEKKLTIGEAKLAGDGLSVELTVGALRAGYVHELKASGLRSRPGEPLAHEMAYYTLNRIPKE